jgi:hypothetical protein
MIAAGDISLRAGTSLTVFHAALSDLAVGDLRADGIELPIDQAGC